ncbi:hypothetical protein ACFFRR_006373 [Megaselia abdita]
MFVKLVYTILILGVLFISTTHAEEGQLQRAAPYPPSGFRPKKAFDLPTEGGKVDGNDKMKDREGKASEGDDVTTTMSPFDETTGYETTTAIYDITTTEFPDLQGNKAERLQIIPRFIVKGEKKPFAYTVQYQQW